MCFVCQCVCFCECLKERDSQCEPSSPAVAQEREVEGDLFLQDMGEGLGFRAGTFDGAISVSALQWLCNADRKTQHPPRRLYRFFSSLYASLVGLECDISLL